MTNREFLNAVISANLSEDMTAHAVKCLDALDRKNASKTSANSKDKVAVADRRNSVLAALTAEGKGIAEVATTCGVSEGQARSALTALVKDGKAVKVAVKSPTGKGKVMVYSLATEGETVTEVTAE